MELERVVVTGLGAVAPIGNTPEEAWKDTLASKSSAALITLFDASNSKTQFVCEVEDLNISDCVDRKAVYKLDHYTQLAMVSATQGVKNAGLDLEKGDKNRIDVIYSVDIGDVKTLEEEVSYCALNKENGPKSSPFFTPKMIAGIVSGQVSIHFGFRGPNYTTASACTSSNTTSSDAFNLIHLGKTDIIVSGGVEAAVTASSVGEFNAVHALSTCNDDPEHASRPFSASRDGFVMGEGAGCLILEELEHAKACGTKIYAEMIGEGANGDAYRITANYPGGLGAKLVMTAALDDAGLKPEDVNYIGVRGTSTPVGDISEVRTIKGVSGDHAYKLNVSSTRSITGHLLDAAGIVEAMACVLAVRGGIIPPAINHEKDDRNLEVDYELNYTFNQTQRRGVHAALSNTFGFGGHNTCVVFKKYAE